MRGMYVVKAATVLLVVASMAAASCGGGSNAGGATHGPTTTGSSTTLPATTSSAVTTSVDTSTTMPPVTTLPPEEPPSQSPEDAARDGVVPAVAVLPFSVRVDVIEAVPAAEGVWAISRLTAAASELAEGCRLGPEEGKYPTDFICTIEYGELLLLDATQSAILRAYPLPGVPAELIEVGTDAVYCGRNGVLPLPDSMVCRVDRATLEGAVRVYPPGIDSVIVQPCFYPPNTWTLDAEPLEVLEIRAGEASVAVRAADGSWTTLDPATLRITARSVELP